MKKVFILNVSKVLITVALISISVNVVASSNWVKVGETSSGKPVMVSPTGTRFESPHYEPFGGNYKGSAKSTGLIVGANGAMSANTVPVVVENKVPKRQVTNAILQKARIAGKALGSGAARLGGAVVGRHPLGIAFSLVTGALVGSPYFWSDEKGDFVKAKDDDTYIVFTVQNGENLISSGELDDAKFKELCDNRKGGCEVLGFVKGGQAADELSQKYCKSKSFKSGDSTRNFEFVGWAGYCSTHGVIGAGDGWRAVKAYRYDDYIPITEDEFFKESEPEADANTNQWVETSGVQPSDEPTATVPAGTVAQTNPYTDPQDGKTKQTRWDFEPGGKVRETVIERPDLPPDSPEAPRLEPQAQDETGTGDKDSPKNGDDDTGKDKEQQEQPDLCEQHPDIMACDKQPEKPDEQDFEIPHEQENLFFTPETVFPSTGRCPAPVSFTLDIPLSGSKTFAFDTMPICEIAVRLRNLVIAMAWLIVSAFCLYSFSRAK